MADIVERLRLYAQQFEDQHAPEQITLAMRAGADEIKRLRERTEYWPDNAERDAVIRHQKEEIERLRAALREAYEVYAGSDGFIPETAGEGYQQQIIRQMVNCISAALGGVNVN